MSDENTNVATLKEAYRQWQETKGGSVAHWLALMTDDVRFCSLADGAKPMEFTSTSNSKEEVKRYFAGLSDEWQMISYQINEYIAQGDRVVALGSCSFRHKKTGRTLETPKATSINFAAAGFVSFSNSTIRRKPSMWLRRRKTSSKRML